MHFYWIQVLSFMPLLIPSGMAGYIQRPELEQRELHSFERRALPEWTKFDAKSAEDQHKIQRLTQAFRDMSTMVTEVVGASDKSAENRHRRQVWDAVFPLYFRTPEAKGPETKGPAPDNEPTVLAILTNMIEPNMMSCKLPNEQDTGSDYLKGIEVFNNDFANLCKPQKKPKRSFQERRDNQDQPTPVAGAYTVSPAHGGTTMHFCDSKYVDVFGYPDLSGLPTSAAQCKATFGRPVSYRMAPLAYILIHELTHAREISQAPLEQAKSKFGKTLDGAYGPEQVRELQKRDMASKNIDGTTGPLLTPIENADSYAWFVVQLYFSLVCKDLFEKPTDNKMAPDGVVKEPKWYELAFW